MLPKTLVIGCGKKQVKHLNEICVVIDISKEALEESKKLRPENEYKEADATNMPFDNNYFEKVIFTEVLQYIDHPKKVLSEIKRVMKKEGELIMSVPIGRTSDFLGKSFHVYERDVVRGHHKYLFTKELIEELLKGFRNIKIQERDKFSTAYWYLWSKINKIFFNDLMIDKDGNIKSEKYPKLVKFVDNFLLFWAFLGQFLVRKDYYKTYYVEAIK